MNIRIIPRLDIKGPNLVKGIHLEGLRVLGKPERFARCYYEAGADELFYQDAVASLYGRNSLHEIVRKTSKEIFIPLCVGGGLRTVEDVRKVLRAGADKVAINTAAIERPQFITEAAHTFGSSTVLVAIDAIKQSDGRYYVLTNYGREVTGIDAIEWARRAVELGAGELMVTSIDREGTGIGFDIDLIRKVATSVSVPVIVSGGCGQLAHVADAVNNGKADAVCLGSVLHYGVIRDQEVDSESDDYTAEGNTVFLSQGRQSSRIEPAKLGDVKRYLSKHGIACRFEAA